MEYDILLCVINHGHCHWTLLVFSISHDNYKNTEILQAIDLSKKQAEYFDAYKGSVQLYWTKLRYIRGYINSNFTCTNRSFIENRCIDQNMAVPKWDQWQYIHRTVS